MKMLIVKIDFEEVELPEHSRICFEKFFDKCADFKFNLKTDCNLAYNSFNNDFNFTSNEFYNKIKKHFDECNY